MISIMVLIGVLRSYKTLMRHAMLVLIALVGALVGGGIAMWFCNGDATAAHEIRDSSHRQMGYLTRVNDVNSFDWSDSWGVLDGYLQGERGTNERSEWGLLLKFVPNGIPLRGDHPLSSKFGGRQHPILNKFSQHKGVDFSVEVGTSVYSTADGVVEVADARGESSFGKYVVVRHGLGFSTLYAHLQGVGVRVGEKVDKGTLLGLSGDSGLSSNPHLHYEVKYLGRALNPENFIVWSDVDYDHIFNEETSVPWASILEEVSRWRRLASNRVDSIWM